MTSKIDEIRIVWAFSHIQEIEVLVDKLNKLNGILDGNDDICEIIAHYKTVRYMVTDLNCDLKKDIEKSLSLAISKLKSSELVVAINDDCILPFIRHD
jgi:hypothetical protein